MKMKPILQYTDETGCVPHLQLYINKTTLSDCCIRKTAHTKRTAAWHSRIVRREEGLYVAFADEHMYMSLMPCDKNTEVSLYQSLSIPQSVMKIFNPSESFGDIMRLRIRMRRKSAVGASWEE